MGVTMHERGTFLQQLQLAASSNVSYCCHLQTHHQHHLLLLPVRPLESPIGMHRLLPLPCTGRLCLPLSCCCHLQTHHQHHLLLLPVRPLESPIGMHRLLPLPCTGRLCLPLSCSRTLLGLCLGSLASHPSDVSRKNVLQPTVVHDHQKIH